MHNLYTQSHASRPDCEGSWCNPKKRRVVTCLLICWIEPLKALLMESFEYQEAFICIVSTSQFPDLPEPQDAASKLQLLAIMAICSSIIHHNLITSRVPSLSFAQVSGEWTVDMNDFYLAVPLREVPKRSPAVGRAVARSSWLEFDGILQRRTLAANWMRTDSLQSGCFLLKMLFGDCENSRVKKKKWHDMTINEW